MYLSFLTYNILVVFLAFFKISFNQLEPCFGRVGNTGFERQKSYVKILYFTKIENIMHISQCGKMRVLFTHFKDHFLKTFCKYVIGICKH